MIVTWLACVAFPKLVATLASALEDIVPFAAREITPLPENMPIVVAALFCVLAEAIVMFTPEGVNVTLLPATNLISCVPEEAPDFVSLNNTSLLESTNDVANTFCVLAIVVSSRTLTKVVPL